MTLLVPIALGVPEMTPVLGVDAKSRGQSRRTIKQRAIGGRDGVIEDVTRVPQSRSSGPLMAGGLVNG